MYTYTHTDTHANTRTRTYAEYSVSLAHVSTECGRHNESKRNHLLLFRRCHIYAT